MAPLTRARRSSVLAKKISSLQLKLHPLVPLPSGPPHPAFPKSLLAFHLLTEEELDSLAHYYHQSTPGPWTLHYPASMNWDKDFLARRSPRTPKTPKTPCTPAGKRVTDDWMNRLVNSVHRQLSPRISNKRRASLLLLGENATSRDMDGDRPPIRYSQLSDGDRMRIKRRKVGKFIGLVGMETPAEEIAGRIQASLDRAVERARQEQRRDEELIMRRRKI